MKNLFKTIFLASCLLVIGSLTAKAQHPTTYPILPSVTQGQYTDFGGVNLVPRDSLLVTDTATYIIPVTHLNDISNYMVFNWQKIGSGTATLTMNFYQSNDPTSANKFQVKKGAANGNYTKSFTLSASTVSEISFARDTAKFEGRYLWVQMITSSTASVKGKYAIRLKTNVK